MLLTITTTMVPATDLGYLLHKHPARVHAIDVAAGEAWVFYPEATEQRCTAALFLEVDPIALVRTRRGPAGEGGTLAQYVNDRPYVGGSFMSVALASAFGTALGGRCKNREELCATAIPLEAQLAALPCRGGEGALRALFEPLGYSVKCEQLPLDPHVPAWGLSRYFSLTLKGNVRLADLLSHLYVLMPVLDDDKHYWVGEAEIQKLMDKASGWLPTHPERDLIVNRYLRHQRRLARAAIEQLVQEEAGDVDAQIEEQNAAEEAVERPLRLHDIRHAQVVSVLREQGVARVLDLGCGTGLLLQLLLKDRGFTEVAGMEVSSRALDIAADRLHLDTMPATHRQRIKLLHGSLTYRDDRLAGYDGAAVIEVIEHLEPSRLSSFEKVVFKYARPGVVVLTTPNADYNVLFPTLPAGNMRHGDHRFEWSREQFEAWCGTVASTYGYTVRLEPVGDVHAEHGAPTQMAIFNRIDTDRVATAEASVASS